MSDLLLKLSDNATARRILRGLRLPGLLPARLRRSEGPWVQRELEGRTVALGGADSGELGAVLGQCLAEAGASTVVVGSDRAAEVYRHASQAWARPVSVLAPVAPGESTSADALLFDATGLTAPGVLRAIYDFFHHWGRRVTPGGRILIVAWEPQQEKTNAATAAGVALDGFTRSLAKELGRRGTTVNLLYVQRQAQARIAGPLRFLLSDHAAFITGQRWCVSDRARANDTKGYTHSLHGSVALVTGAARGIGAETAAALAREGAHVVCLDRPGEVENLLHGVVRGVHGSMLLLDITDPDAPAKVEGYLKEKHGGVDIVVHNAGIVRDRTLGKMSVDAWESVLRVNLSSAMGMTERLLSERVLRENGRLLFLSSVSGIAGNVGQTNYAAAKSGVVGYMQRLAGELAPWGITVNAVAPGLIETPMTAQLPLIVRHLARRFSALGQAGLPKDVAETLAFLAMPVSQGITGSVVRVCGGSYLGA